MMGRLVAAMPEQTYTSIGLAVEQLDSAIAHFLNRRSFISALTLAGAAEELLGKTLRSMNERNALEWQYVMMEPTLSLFMHTTLSKQDFITIENRARDAAKHWRPDPLELDIEDAALSMIVRASDNARRLGLEATASTKAFDDWFYEHVVGY